MKFSNNFLNFWNLTSNSCLVARKTSCYWPSLKYTNLRNMSTFESIFEIFQLLPQIHVLRVENYFITNISIRDKSAILIIFFQKLYRNFEFLNSFRSEILVPVLFRLETNPEPKRGGWDRREISVILFWNGTSSIIVSFCNRFRLRNSRVFVLDLQSYYRS